MNIAVVSMSSSIPVTVFILIYAVEFVLTWFTPELPCCGFTHERVRIKSPKANGGQMCFENIGVESFVICCNRSL